MILLEIIWNILYSLLLIALYPLFLLAITYVSIVTIFNPNKSAFDTIDKFNHLLSKGYFPVGKSNNINKIGNVNGSGNKIIINQRVTK